MAPNTAALAAISVPRWGAAAKVERIMPVEYSPVTASTPSTPMASWATITPPRLFETGSKPAVWVCDCAAPMAATTPTKIMAAAATTRF